MKRLGAALLLVSLGSFAGAEDAVDAQLDAAIARIAAIDNHTHADAVDPERSSRWQSARPLGASRYPDVVPLARDHVDWRRAWRALYGYAHDDASMPHLQALLEAKRTTLAAADLAWPVSVLDKANVEVALVNTARLGPGLTGPRFRWVPYADPLLRPFSGDESRLSYSGGDVSVSSLMAEVGISAPPATLGEYRAKVIAPTLARWKANSAVAVKFLSAYARGLDFEPVPEEVAAALFLERKDTKQLEDYLFNAIAMAAGDAGLVVHVHTGNGDGPYFNNRRASPDLLENALNSKPLRNTRFVLLHGGWPYHEIARAMTDKPNTFVDFSAQTFYLDTHHLAQVLRGYLAWHPEKVLFGTDAYSDVDSPLVDWEEKEWVCAWRARRALAAALTAMLRDQEISRERALAIARLVLHDNAAQLYGLGP
jgi:uncharacterized protein